MVKRVQHPGQSGSGILGSDIGGDEIFDTDELGMFGDIMDIGLHNTQESLSYCMETLKTVLEKNKNTLGKLAITADVSYIPSGESESSSNLTCDTLTLALTKDGKTSARCILITPPDLTYTPYTKQVGESQHRIDRYDSEQDDPDLRNQVINMLSRSHGTTADNIFLKKASIPARSFVYDKEHNREVMILCIKLLQSIMSSLLMDVTGTLKDMRMSDIAKDSGADGSSGLSVRVTRNDRNEPSVNQDGVLINPTVSTTVAVRHDQKGKNYSVHTTSALRPIGQVDIRASVAYRPMAATQATYGTAQSYPNCFSPHIIIENMSLTSSPSLSRMANLLACTTVLFNSNTIQHLYGNNIGLLNIRANIDKAAKSQAIPSKTVAAHKTQVFHSLFNPKVVVSMILRPGGAMYDLEDKWLESITNPTGSTIAHAMDWFTGGRFMRDPNSGAMKNVALVSPKVDIAFVGVYTDSKNKERPLTEIDLLWLYEHVPTQTALIDKYMAASSGRFAPDVSAAMKREVIEVATEGKFEVYGVAPMITFNPEVFTSLRQAFADNGVNPMTNSNFLGTVDTSGWEAYMAAASAFDLGNMGTDPFINTMDVNARNNQHTATYW